MAQRHVGIALDEALEPGAVTSSSNKPTGKAGSSKPPCSLLVVARDTFVPYWTTVTSALGTTAPDGSFTVPRKVPVVWARKQAAESNMIGKQKKFRRLFIVLCFGTVRIRGI